MKHGLSFLVCVVASVLIVATLPGNVSAETPVQENRGATADAFVVSSLPNDNFGTNVNLYAGQEAVPPYTTWRSFVRFNLTNAPIDNDTINITGVSVVLYKTGHDAGFPASYSFGLVIVTASWVETTITWNNMPPNGANAAFAPITQANIPYYWNITYIYNLWAALNFTNNYGLKLYNAGSVPPTFTRAVFASRENANASRRPYMLINYTVATPPPPPPPPGPATFDDFLWGYITVFIVGVVIVTGIGVRRFRAKGGL